MKGLCCVHLCCKNSGHCWVRNSFKYLERKRSWSDMPFLQTVRKICIDSIEHVKVDWLTCNVVVFPSVQAELGSLTAFLLLSLFSMAHLHCAGQQKGEEDWLLMVTWLKLIVRAPAIIWSGINKYNKVCEILKYEICVKSMYTYLQNISNFRRHLQSFSLISHKIKAANLGLRNKFKLAAILNVGIHRSTYFRNMTFTLHNKAFTTIRLIVILLKK